jgi:cytoskeletal protein CcmA (bactofilin family)
MSKSSKTVAPSEPEPPRPARRFTDPDESTVTILAAGLRIVGDLRGADSVDLSGTLEGDAEVDGFFRVREAGRVNGSIKADRVLVEGEVHGESILARGKVELGARARVKADIDAATLAMGEGCFLQGRVHMREGGAGQVAFKERRKQ